MGARQIRLAVPPALLCAVAALLVPSAALARTTSSFANAERQMTGLSAASVTSVNACPPAIPGHATCAAQTLVRRGTRAPVRPHPGARRALRQVARNFAGAAAVAAAAPPQVGTPAYFQQAYDLTYLSQVGGGSDTVAIVDAYNDPTAEADLAQYRASYGLPACTTANGCFAKLNQSGAATPLPARNAGWEQEISLDLDAVSAICPNCQIRLVEARSSALTDLSAAMARAAALGADQISVSWGASSSRPPAGTYTFSGIAVLAATGDTGYLGPGSDSYPAALAGVTAVGGTRLAPAVSGASARGFAEAAWDGGGSGCAAAVPKPAYQTDTGCTGRAYADISAVAEPSTGLVVYDSGNGGWLLMGGTSLSTPMAAGYYAIAGITSAGPQWAYAAQAKLNDPSSGANGTCANPILYICAGGAGYDGPTGVGSISGAVVAGAPGIGGPSIAVGTTDTYTLAADAATATLRGGVYANGIDTSYWWQYGPTSGYGQQTAPVDVGSGPAPSLQTASLTGLSPSTAYHYRLVAQNSAGTSYGYDYTFSTTAATAAGTPANVQAPSITGTPQRTATLTARLGIWAGASGYLLQWQRNAGAGFGAIAGATGATYVPVKADEGARLRLLVTATSPAGNIPAVSPDLGPVIPAPPTTRSKARITGTVKSGSKLTAEAGVWTPGGAALTYQWERCNLAGSRCKPVAGARGRNYSLGGHDIGATIRVIVTAGNVDGRASARSAASKKIRAVAPGRAALRSAHRRRPVAPVCARGKRCTTSTG